VNRLPAVRLRIPASQSIGVVTFNGDPQRLIENQARRSDPSLEAHFDLNQTNEPILVKNIENVQGNERDVIIFSVAVGPDKNGRITAQISSHQQRRRPRPP
jgi:superfamily I DNA and/or RNA helicase